MGKRKLGTRKFGKRNTFARVIHDLGLGAWFGGSLMGAVGLNAATKQVTEPTERIQVANAGWTRWTPVNAVGIGAYLLGGAALLGGNKGRLRSQSGVRQATLAKNVLTVLTGAATAYARVLGQRLMQYEKVPVHDGTTPTEETPGEVAKIQKQLKLLQYAIPVHVAGLIGINALMGEQQRPIQVARGMVRQRLRRVA